MGLTIVVPYRFCAVANTARFGKWMLANTTGIVYMAFLNVVLLTQQLGYIAISVLYRNMKLVA